MIKKLLFIYSVSFLFLGCSSPKVITSWKAQHPILPVHKIMVVGIIKEGNDSLRREIEGGLVKKLSEIGYYGISALGEFGPKGLSDLGQEATYIKLCNNGIDAVLTIALIDQVKMSKYDRDKSTFNINSRYYNRIWNYRKIQNDSSVNEPVIGTRFIWESILFDLSTLEPLCVIQTSSFIQGKENEEDYMQQILDKMKKEKILLKQNIQPLKPF